MMISITRSRFNTPLVHYCISSKAHPTCLLVTDPTSRLRIRPKDLMDLAHRLSACSPCSKVARTASSGEGKPPRRLERRACRFDRQSQTANEWTRDTSESPLAVNSNIYGNDVDYGDASDTSPLFGYLLFQERAPFHFGLGSTGGKKQEALRDNTGSGPMPERS